MHGLYLLWWVQEKDLSPAVVAAVLAAGDLVLLAVELPTGWFADKLGHRASLIAGSLVQVAGMLWCWLGEGITGLVVSSVLIALGDGFRSGAGEALLYRSCVAIDRERAFHPIQARAAALETAALAGLVLAGGLIVTRWGFAAGWIAEVLLCSAGLGIAYAMREPPPAAEHEASDEPDDFRASLSIPLAILIAPASLIGGLAAAGSFLAQTSPAATAGTVTLLVAAITLAEAAGAAAAAHVRAGGARSQAALMVIGAALFAAGLALPPIFPAVTLALALLDGLARPLRTTALQRASADGARARMASLASACDMAVSMVALPVAGLVRTRRHR